MRRLMMALLAGMVAAGGTVQGASPAELRKQAAEHREKGNWKDALAVHETLLEEVSDEQSGEDLKWAVAELRSLNEIKRFDELVEGAVERHAANWRVIFEAGHLYLTGEHWGYIIDGEFQRGHHRGGGQWTNATERDRVRALQLFLRAQELAGEAATAAERGRILESLARAITMQRTSRQHVWALGILTPLDELPDYEAGSQLASGSGAPVDDDGDPLWMAVPESWEAAANDGERWRWLLETMKVLGVPQKAVDLEYRWAQFLVQHYGVRTMAEFSWWRTQGPDEQEGILQVHTLKDDESIAKLAGGVKRFSLPEGFRFIAILGENAAAHGSSADLLVQVYLDRRQYVKAAAVLETAIGNHGAGPNRSRAKLLKQIRGDWGRFEAVPMMPAGEKPQVPYVFRNAGAVALEVHRIKIDLVVDDIFAFLEGNPRELDWEKINVGAIGQRLVAKNERKYLGERLAEWEVDLEPHDGHWDKREMLEVPVTEAGAYLLKATAGDGNTTWIVVWLSDTVLVKHALKEAWAYYLGDAKGAAPVAGELQFFAYRVENREGAKRVLKKFDILTRRFSEKTGKDGLAMVGKDKLAREYQWMVRARGPGGRRAYLGFQSHYWRDWRWDDFRQERSMGITDRPVYRPGQSVHMKFWSRAARYDLGDVSTFAGRTCRAEIHHQGTGKVHEVKNLRTDAWGGVEFDWELPEDARLGRYSVNLQGAVPGGGLTFRVEEYKKPEYEVTVEAPKEPVRLGEEIEATVQATYYHGAPVTEAKVKIKVQRFSHSERWFPSGRWDWLYGRGYWWFGSSYEWYPGWERWGCVPPVPSWWGGQRWTPPELVLEREEQVGADGTVTVKIDTSVAKLAHGDIDHRYEITAEVVDASRRTIVGKGSVLAAREPYQVTTWLDRGYARPGDIVTLSFAARTLDGRPVTANGTGTLYRVGIGDDGKVSETKVKEWDLQAGDSGEGDLKFNAPEAGQYRFAVVLTDAKGNEQAGATVFVVRGEGDEGRGMRFNDLELVLEKKEYEPGETAKILVNTNQRGARVLLFLRSNGFTAEELKVVRVKGKSREYELPLEKRDMPNMFVEAVTIAGGRVVTVAREIVLPPEKRLLTVEVEPGKERYKPREKTGVTIRLKDENGEPYKGTAVVTVYDKSLEYISGGSNVPEIRKFFWDWKRRYSQGRLQHSQIWGGGNLVKPKTDAMQILGRFGGGTAELADGRSGFGRAEGAVMRKSALAVPAAAPATLSMDSIAADEEGRDAGLGDAAGDAGGGPEVVVRSEFADLVKWAGSVETNADGEAVIDLEMPDNLTTWKIKTWAMGHGTRVGEGEAEIITSKDLIVRLQAPRFFVETDVVTLSAVVHNYHAEAKEVEVSLELDGGTLEARGGNATTVVIPAKGEERVDWTAVAKREGEVTVRMKAIAADDADAMEMTFPVYVHGMARTESWSRQIGPEGKKAVIEIEVPEKRRPNETRLEIRYSPTIAGAMVDALPYLANYPYGCTEQTLNRFVPTVITQKLLQDMGVDLAEVRTKRVNLNPQEIGDAGKRAAQWKHWKENPVWDKDEVDKMVREGVQRLREMQNGDGGWGWFSAWGEQSYPHTTAVVVHGLLMAKENGAAVPDDMLGRGVAWLKKHEAKEAERIRMWKKRKRNTKERAGNIDALVRRVLGEAGENGREMERYLFRDKNQLAVYAKCLLGLELHRVENMADRDVVLKNIEQFLVTDDENQTAWLNLGNGGYWWYWYGSEFEAHAWYLKLLAAVKPGSPQARGLVKYLVNNRKHANYWRSTRDTAYCVEALADFLRGSGEDAPEMEIEVRLDGKVLKTVTVTKENLFSFDGTVVVAGDALGAGKHTVELRKKGRGPLYANAYLTVFSLEDFLRKAGLEVKVERSFYKLVPVEATQDVAGSKGQALKQKKEKFERVALQSGDQVVSGDLIEVELSVESKNDYSYLVFEDWKAAGLEPVEVRSGYNRNGLGAFMELRDERVAMFVRSLPRGRHNLSYRLRAEIPGTFSALPTRAEGMYAPELKGNSDEMKLSVRD
ncbi:MAG: alpha-2-macroglobulin [Akkermansiaceae bacterium]|nr:alpha-2-macroglobulin [Akkermansiaceae bacterium]